MLKRAIFQGLGAAPSESESTCSVAAHVGSARVSMLPGPGWLASPTRMPNMPHCQRMGAMKPSARCRWPHGRSARRL
eukprot:4742053-Karenia_brevis.AAC.1